MTVRRAAGTPRSVEAQEQRARLLAEAGRPDEARAACRPEAWGGPTGTPPPAPRAREALVVARAGELAAAIGQMKQVVEEDPGFYWGWCRLVEWYTRTGDQSARLETAALLAARWPQDANAQVWHGDALLAGKGADQGTAERAAAKAAYRRAVALAPSPPIRWAYVFLAAVVGATIAVRRTSSRSRAEGRRVFADIEGKLAEAEKQYPKFAWEMELRRFRRRALARMARSGVGLRGWLWCRWRIGGRV